MKSLTPNGSRLLMENNGYAERESARTVGRILKILELLAGEKNPLRLVDICKALGMPRSSAHVLMQQLVEFDYVRTVEGRRYTQSSGLVVLASRTRAGTQLIQTARPFITKLGADSGESIYLGIRTPQGIVYVDAVEATHGLVSRTPLGSLRPMHASSAGRVYLAFGVPEADLDEFLGPDPLVAFTPHTPTDLDELKRILRQIREEGCAVNEQTMAYKIYGVSAPIFDANAELTGTITLSAPDTRFVARRDFFISRVLEAAGNISRALGLSDPSRIHVQRREKEFDAEPI